MTGVISEPIRVVVVDDEPDVCLLLSVQFGLLPDFVVVGTAGDGAAAVDAARDLRPDAVVLDLLMPGVNGFEAIQRIRSESPGVTIVAHTGVAGSFVRAEMERLGVPLVLKSGKVDALASAVREAVNGSE